MTTEVLGENPFCMSLCPPYVGHGLAWKCVGKENAAARHLWEDDIK